MKSRGAGGRGLLALGAALATHGPLAKISVAIAGLTTFGVVVLSFVVARSDKAARIAHMPALAASLLAWGAGVLLAFAASSHAFRRDREQGIRALAEARGQSAVAYLWSRIAGLALRLFAVVGGGTLVVGGVAMLLAASAAALLRTAQTAGAALLFALVFALTMAPLALAMLGARSRAGGYAVLVVVLGVPELMQTWTSQMLPEGWGELASIPGAMLAMLGALSGRELDPLRLWRAVAVLALVAVIALVFARAQLTRADAEMQS